MYTKILVPLDGSPLAEQVLPYVQILARDLKAQVELLCVISPVPAEMSDPQHGQFTDRLSATFRSQAQESLKGYADSFQALGIPVASTAEEGDAAHEIINRSAREPETLIAMSTHGRSGISRWVFGSVTDKVLHATSNPLLMIRARPTEQYTPGTVSTRGERWSTVVGVDTVVIPLDGSPIAEQALPHGVAVAKALGLNVNLVRVVGSSADEGEASSYLGQIAEKTKQEGVSALQQRVVQGDAANAIVELTRDSSNNLIAMTTHGHSGVGHWALGSVTDRVVRYSGAPVLITRAVGH